MGLYGSPNFESYREIDEKKDKKQIKSIYCWNCGLMYGKKVGRCPRCGKHHGRTIFNKWWFWVVLIIAAYIIYPLYQDNQAIIKDIATGQLFSFQDTSDSIDDLNGSREAVNDFMTDFKNLDLKKAMEHVDGGDSIIEIPFDDIESAKSSVLNSGSLFGGVDNELAAHLVDSVFNKISDEFEYQIRYAGENRGTHIYDVTIKSYVITDSVQDETLILEFIKEVYSKVLQTPNVTTEGMYKMVEESFFNTFFAQKNTVELRLYLEKIGGEWMITNLTD